MDQEPFGNSAWTAEEKGTIQRLLEQKMGLDSLSFRPGPANSTKPFLWPALTILETLVYTATSTIIEEVNNIFGPDGWSSCVSNMTQDFLEEEEPGKWTCACSAIVKITLKNGTHHEDLGYGVARKQPSEFKAIETAKKTAVSDGLKRSLRNFGHALGNCLAAESFQKKMLKEKTQKHNVYQSIPARPPPTPQFRAGGPMPTGAVPGGGQITSVPLPTGAVPGQITSVPLPMTIKAPKPPIIPVPMTTGLTLGTKKAVASDHQVQDTDDYPYDMDPPPQ